LRKKLARSTADRDQYRRELFLSFPPPDYTDAEIAEFMKNRVPAEEGKRNLLAKNGYLFGR